MRCANCATDNAPGNKFCTGCGTALASLCRQCGRAVPPTARFCGACGTPQAVTVPRVTPQGERKQATVLFVDIVGSTELIAGLDAEQAGQRLQPAVSAMVEAVRTGEITQERLDASVLKILQAKSSLGLDKNRMVDVAAIPKLVGSPENAGVGQRISDASVTLVRDKGNLLPLRTGRGDSAVRRRAGGRRRHDLCD